MLCMLASFVDPSVHRVRVHFLIEQATKHVSVILVIVYLYVVFKTLQRQGARPDTVVVS